MLTKSFILYKNKFSKGINKIILLLQVKNNI